MSDLSILENLDKFTTDNKHSSKRRKLDKYSKFKPGFIVKVKLENFTTYSYAEFNLSPSLNMIIGPNGSGKSTLVAAICLGLGGKVDLIKRKNLKSMIKTGQERAMIEIHLKNSGDEPNIVIKRLFTAKETTWTIDGKHAREKLVKDTCKKFNIQLDNLCHFLPQERVAEFASLTPEQLLLETERTLGDGHLLIMHDDLVKMDSQKQILIDEIDQIEQKLSKMKEEKEKLEEEAKKYEEYAEKSRELKNHEMLIPYAQLNDLKIRQKHLKVERDRAKKELEAFIEKLKPLNMILTESQNCMRSEEEKYDECVEMYKRIESELGKLKANHTENKDKIEALKATKKALSIRSENKFKELETLKESREELKRTRERMTEIDDDEMEKIRLARDVKHEVVNELEAETELIKDKLLPLVTNIKKHTEEIKREEQRLLSTDKLTLLEPNSRYVNKLRDDAYKGHILLRENRGFKYAECPVVSCNTTSKKYAHYLEKVIDNNTLFAITLTSQEEYERVSSFLLNQCNIPMRVIQKICNPKLTVNTETLKKLGFDGYLSDFIDGPKEVLSMLYDTSKIDTIPVSASGLNDKQIQFLTQPNKEGQVLFKKFISGDTLFNIHRSQYGSRQFFYTTEAINPVSHYFGRDGLSQQTKDEIISNVEKLKEYVNSKRVAYKELQDKSNEVKSKLTEELSNLSNCKERLDTMLKIKSKITSLESTIRSRSEQIEKLEIQAQKDYSEKIVQIENKVNEKYDLNGNIMKEISVKIKELAMQAIQVSQQELKYLQSKNRVITISELLNSLKEQNQKLVEVYNSAKAKYDLIKKSDAAQKILEQSRNYSETERTILSDLAAHYMNAGLFTEHNIREKIALLEDERSVMATADQSAINNLKRKLEEILYSEKELPRIKLAKNGLDERIESIRRKWEPELTSMIQKISVSFNRNFTKVACDGQVELAKNERFKDWRLQILVKFRQESELKILDHQSQSGGERAVSTIFFIMSLQGQTEAPLRVVDEINQGMDPRNEKMAHRYLVHTACNNSNSQYFLVTPKLLTGLYYHPSMVVHCIYTGPLIDPVDRESTEPDFMDFNRLIST